MTDSKDIDFTLTRRRGEPWEDFAERQREASLDARRDAMAEERRIAEAEMRNVGAVFDVLSAAFGGRK